MGLRNLEQRYKEQVRTGNLFIHRTAEAARAIHLLGGGFAIENPPPHDGNVSLWDLDIIVKLEKDTQASSVDFDQCPYGAESQKPTRIMYKSGDFFVLELQCNHPVRDWKDDRGRPYRARHPPLVGRWLPDGRRATKAAAAYPGDLNEGIAYCIASSQS